MTKENLDGKFENDNTFENNEAFDLRKCNYPEDIAGVLSKLAHRDNISEITEEEINKSTDAIYCLYSFADNPLNKDTFRTLYKVLSDIVDNAGEYLDSEAIPFC